MTILPAHRRGDTFVMSFTLGGGWVGADFTGGVKFTMRPEMPDSAVVDDLDAMEQASVATGEIVFAGAVGTVTIPASRTNVWKTGRIFWDLQGVITGTPNRVEPLDDGTISIRPDVTRSL